PAELAPRREERLEQLARLASEEAALDRRPVVDDRLREQVDHAAHGAPLRVCRGVDEARDPGQRDRPGAHRAGLEGDEQGRLEPPPAPQPLRCLPHGEHLGVRGGVPAQLALVAGLPQHLAPTRDDRADRHVAVLGGTLGEGERAAHQPFIGAFVAHGQELSQQDGVYNLSWRPAPASSPQGTHRETMRKLIATTMLFSVAALAPAAAAGADDATAHSSYVPGELLVRFDGGAEHVLKLPDGVTLPEAEQALDANPAVAYATPNYIAHASGIPNDPGPSGVPGGWQRTQWNFLPCGSLCGETPTQYQAKGGLNAPEAWDILKQRGVAGGRGARVAVLDTGIAYMNKKPHFKRSPDFSRSQFLPGYDFVDKDKLPLDEDGHGTHVAGTIAEKDNNHIALTGLAPNAKIIPVRVLDSEGF